MHLAHREIMEAEGEIGCGVGVRLLLLRQGDVEADARRAGFARPAIGRLHDAGATARGDDILAHRAMRLERAAAFRRDAPEEPCFSIPEGLPTGPVLAHP